MDKLGAMRAFVKVAETGSFSAAASLLGRSKAVISKQLAMLEAALGVQLLVRTTRRVRLSDAGRAYLERCAPLLADLEELESSVQQSQSSPRGLLRVAGPQTFSELHLATPLRAFLTRYPELEVELVLTDRLVDLVEQGFDVALRIGELEDSRLLARRLADSSIVICASPAYLARRGVPRTPEALAGHDLVLDSNLRQPQTWRFRRGSRTVGVRVAGRLQVNSAVMVRHFLLEGRASACARASSWKTTSPREGWCRCWRSSPATGSASTRSIPTPATCRGGCGCSSTSWPTTSPRVGAARPQRCGSSTMTGISRDAARAW